MSNLILRSTNPNSIKKPTIIYQDKINTHPHTAAEASDANTHNMFYENGALRILNSNKITINGITVNGGGPYAYGYNGVFVPKGGANASPLFNGNSAIMIYHSGASVIKNCEITNAYHGIYVYDHNYGGIFYPFSTSYLDPLNIVPGSTFGKTGNHIFEHNRIHDNAWGMFFEAAWDLGSTIRYNLFYSNYIKTDFRTIVKALPDGSNEPGGALFFKDDMLSPLAIYNNTFWHNYLLLAGHWRAGSQYLIFNNIYSSPYQAWGKVADNEYMEMDPVYVNRIHNVVYSVQQQALGNPLKYFIQVLDTGLNKTINSDTTTGWQPLIMNELGMVQTDSIKKSINLSDGTVYSKVFNVIREGNQIVNTSASSGMPSNANARWLESHFKSTDTVSADFLVPDWNDSLVKQFIVDQGWSGADIRDSDGTAADLGAISSAGSASIEAVITPTYPVTIEGTTATARFDLSCITGNISNPVIKYMNWVNNVMNPKDSNSWSSGVTPISAADLILIPAPSSPIVVGSNKITFTVPQRTASQKYAFLELTIQGTSSDGKTVTSNVGFLPFNQDVNVPLKTIVRPSLSISNPVSADLIDLRGQVIRRAENLKNGNRAEMESALQTRTLPRGVYLIRMRGVGGSMIIYRQIIK